MITSRNIWKFVIPNDIYYVVSFCSHSIHIMELWSHTFLYNFFNLSSNNYPTIMYLYISIVSNIYTILQDKISWDSVRVPLILHYNTYESDLMTEKTHKHEIHNYMHHMFIFKVMNFRTLIIIVHKNNSVISMFVSR